LIEPGSELNLATRHNAPYAETAGRYGQAITGLGTELGTRALAVHYHLGLGKLYHRTGDRSKAQEHLTTAAKMFREVDMRFWLEKAEAARAEVG
jgi:hypothetical protein